MSNLSPPSLVLNDIVIAIIEADFQLKYAALIFVYYEK
jgi:hypothetical protein